MGSLLSLCLDTGPHIHAAGAQTYFYKQHLYYFLPLSHWQVSKTFVWVCVCVWNGMLLQFRLWERSRNSSIWKEFGPSVIWVCVCTRVYVCGWGPQFSLKDLLSFNSHHPSSLPKCQCALNFSYFPKLKPLGKKWANKVKGHLHMHVNQLMGTMSRFRS